MILVFTPRITNRIQYIVKTVLNGICGFEYTVTHSGEEFLNFKGARINYSDRELPVDCLQIMPSGLLLEKGVKDFTPMIEQGKDFPLLFPVKNENKRFDLDYDIFSASFYLLSRYEEYLPFLEDRHGRFEADQSLAYQKGFLEKPVVDLMAKQLNELLMEKFPFLKSNGRKFTFLPTYDIDVAYAFKGRGPARNAFIFAADILTFNFKRLSRRIAVLSGKEKDPFDTYDFQLEIQRKYKLKPVYFFLSGGYGTRDRNISIHSRAFMSLVKTIGDYAQAGIHPSYASNDKPYKLSEETKFLASVLNRKIENSRQHYLKIRFPYTYQNLLKTDIRKDYSMGFASHVGFRAGTCSIFTFYDLTQESETKLKIFPLSVMDGTLKDYMKLKQDEALEKVKKLIDTVKDVNGLFMSLWHNDALSQEGAWEHWREVYVETIKYAISEPNIGADV